MIRQQLAAWHVDLTIPSFGIQEENHFASSVHELLPGTAELRHRYSLWQRRTGSGFSIRVKRCSSIHRNRFVPEIPGRP
jgi:hypothetical protein